MGALTAICNIAIDVGDTGLLAEHAHRGLTLSQKLQSPAWEAAFLGFQSIAHYQESDLDLAERLAEDAVSIGDPARAFMGGWTLGPLSVVTRSPRTRTRILSEGDELINQGMNASGLMQFVRFAMMACWNEQWWDRLEGYADFLNRYTQAEPTPWSDFFIGSGRALAAIGRGNRSIETKEQLERLSERAVEMGYRASDTVLADALSRAT